MRKARYVLAGLAITVLVVTLAGVGWVYATNPRDEAGYLAYLQRYGRVQPRTDTPLPASLIDEGDRACEWLGDQPFALWRTGTKYRNPSLMNRYGDENADRAREMAGDGIEFSSVVAGAWGYLCPATWEFHKPRYVFSDPSGD